MASDLPEEFDVIVLGTGLPETLLAAAFSRIGLTVLHLDRNNYYSGSWASFSLRQIPSWVEEQKKSVCYVSDVDQEKLSTLVKEGEKALQLPETFPVVFDAECKYHVGERPKEEPEAAQPPSSTSSAKEGAESDVSAVSPPTTTAKADTEGASPSETPQKEDAAKGGSQSQDEDTKVSSDVVPGQFDSAPEEGEESQTAAGQERTATASQAGEANSATATAATDVEKRREWFADDVQKEWRKFSFDLAPKLLYCSGSMVELLIVSDVAKYCEFRTLSRVLTMRDGKLEKVPCSRADVFSSKALSLLEKRLLMKFLTFAAQYDEQPDEYKDFLDKPFVEFLASKKLSSKIQYFILHSIAMATESTSTEQGLKSTQKFLRSLGRYGNTAFLFPLYGSGELPQGFCRLSAVFGGIYVLTLSASHLLVDDNNKCTGVITSAGQRIGCKYLIADPSYLLKEFYQVPESSPISRGIFVTDRSIFPGEEEDLSLLQMPHEGQVSSPTTSVLELPPSAMVSPRHLYVVHMTRRAVSDVQSDLQPAVATLFEGTDETEEEKEAHPKPKLLWSLCFQQRDLSEISRTDQTPDNMFVVTGPGVELDSDRCVEEAKTIFKQICPEEEFLPKPPHPDDIIYVDTEEVSAIGNEQSDWTADADAADKPETSDDAASGQAAAEKAATEETQNKDGEEGEVMAGSGEPNREGDNVEGAKAETGDKQTSQDKKDSDKSDVQAES